MTPRGERGDRIRGGLAVTDAGLKPGATFKAEGKPAPCSPRKAQLCVAAKARLGRRREAHPVGRRSRRRGRRFAARGSLFAAGNRRVRHPRVEGQRKSEQQIPRAAALGMTASGASGGRIAGRGAAANTLRGRAGGAYDARNRGPGQKSGLNSNGDDLETADQAFRESVRLDRAALGMTPCGGVERDPGPEEEVMAEENSDEAPDQTIPR
jgi:hypothetical protein